MKLGQYGPCIEQGGARKDLYAGRTHGRCVALQIRKCTLSHADPRIHNAEDDHVCPSNSIESSKLKAAFCALSHFVIEGFSCAVSVLLPSARSIVSDRTPDFQTSFFLSLGLAQFTKASSHGSAAWRTKSSSSFQFRLPSLDAFCFVQQPRCTFEPRLSRGNKQPGL